MLHLWCISGVERHRARLIRLEYQGEGPIDKTLLLVGKVSTCIDTNNHLFFTLSTMSVKAMSSHITEYHQLGV